jgi:hypothetical protein
MNEIICTKIIEHSIEANLIGSERKFHAFHCGRTLIAMAIRGTHRVGNGQIKKEEHYFYFPLKWHSFVDIFLNYNHFLIFLLLIKRGN